MRLIIELSQSNQGRLDGTVTHPVTAAEIPFEGVVELVGVLEQHLRSDDVVPAPGRENPAAD
jgi:hypothetical protein